jgi:hypothetical protein
MRNKGQGVEETISLQALFICLCVCVFACAIRSLVLLISNGLWTHHASEVPRDLIALRLWSGSWGVGALERWRCARALSVVVSASLCFFCLYVCLMQRMMTCEPWGLKGFFERFGLWNVLTWLVWVWRSLGKRFGGVKTLRGFDLSVMSVIKLIWKS